MSRWRAATIHLSISAAIAAVALALLFGLWYPPPYFHAAGADELVLLLVGVDLAIGPLITLIVFRSGKRGMKFDLCVIAALQSAALVYGMWVVLQSRPVFLVGVLDRFVLVSANEITDEDLALGSEPRFRSRSWTGPRLVVTEMPTSIQERNALTSAAFDGRDVQNQPRYYREYVSGAHGLLAKAHTLDLLRRPPDHAREIENWLETSHRSEATVRWLPIQARKADIVLLLDAANATPLKAMDIDPPVW